jgi:hypothetical protein
MGLLKNERLLERGQMLLFNRCGRAALFGAPGSHYR